MSQRVVSFHYTLKNKNGETLDSSRDAEPMTYVEGKRQIIRGLEEELKGLSTGDKKAVVIPADKAYGAYDKALVMKINRDQFPKDEKIEVGDQFRVAMPGNEGKIFTVMGLTDAHIDVDGNHPLAGEDLHFDVEVTEAREAQEADLKDHACCDHDHDHDHGSAHPH